MRVLALGKAKALCLSVLAFEQACQDVDFLCMEIQIFDAGEKYCELTTSCTRQLTKSA